MVRASGLYFYLPIEGGGNATTTYVDASVTTVRGVRTSCGVPGEGLPVGRSAPGPISGVPCPATLSYLNAVTTATTFDMSSYTPVPVPREEAPTCDRRRSNTVGVGGAGNVSDGMSRTESAMPCLSWDRPGGGTRGTSTAVTTTCDERVSTSPTDLSFATYDTAVKGSVGPGTGGTIPAVWVLGQGSEYTFKIS